MNKIVLPLLAVFVLVVSAENLKEDLPNFWRKIEFVGPYPSARYGHSWEIKDNAFGVLFGGFGPAQDGSLVDLNDIWLFDVANHNWTEVKAKPGSSVPPPRRWHTCNMLEHTKMYCFGGKSLTGILGDFWYFDFVANQWFQVTGTPLMTPRYGHTGNNDCSEKKIIFFGGATADGLLNDMYIYDTESDSWVEVKTAVSPPARVFHSMVVSDCELMPDPFDLHMTMHGGKVRMGSGAMDVWAFDMSAATRATWVEDTYRPDDVPLRFGHFGFDIGNVMLIWGGSVSDLDVYYYNQDHRTWYSREPFAANHPPQLRFAAAELSFNLIFMFGGYDLLHESISDEMWMYTIDPCMFQTTCDTCIQKQPQCGWCATKHACLSGEGEPTYESCPIWRTKTCVNSCFSRGTCDDCTADINCGWCFRTPSYPHVTEGCLAGSPEGPWFGDCFEWSFDQEQCPECQAQSSCGECLLSPYCGYCPSLGKCMDGTSAGPANGTCPDWVRDVRQCKLPTNCYTHATCDECTKDSSCGFCDDEDVPVHCVPGTSRGPLTGTCKDWLFSNCTPHAECGIYRSCRNCVTNSACGWCNDLGVNRCTDGSSAGPSIGVCHAWSFTECVVPYPTPAPSGIGAGWVVFIIIIILGIGAGGFCFYWFYWRNRGKRTMSYSSLSATGGGYGSR